MFLKCDSHSVIAGKERNLAPRSSYLLSANYMQNSVVQEALLDDLIKQNPTESRESHRRKLLGIQGHTPWLLCDWCVAVIGLSAADREAAKQAEHEWREYEFWKSKGVPQEQSSPKGHAPKERPLDEKLNGDERMTLGNVYSTHPNTRLRVHAINYLAKYSKFTADDVRMFIYDLKEGNINDAVVRLAILDALRHMTGLDFGNDDSSWIAWWRENNTSFRAGLT